MAELVSAVGIAVSAITATVAYLVNQRQSRRARQAQLFAEALLAVSNFRNYPFLVARRSIGDSREKLVNIASSVHASLDYHADLLRLEAPALAAPFDDVLRAARKEYNDHGKRAWEMAPVAVDADMNRGLGSVFLSPETDKAISRCLSAMASELGHHP